MEKQTSRLETNKNHARLCEMREEGVSVCVRVFAFDRDDDDEVTCTVALGLWGLGFGWQRDGSCRLGGYFLVPGMVHPTKHRKQQCYNAKNGTCMFISLLLCDT